MDVLTSLMVKIILQYIQAPNHPIVHLKLTVLRVNYNSIKLGRNENSEVFVHKVT